MTVMAVEVSNVVFFASSMAAKQIRPKQRLWRYARKEDDSDGGREESHKQGEELKVVIDIDCGRRKRRPSW